MKDLENILDIVSRGGYMSRKLLSFLGNGTYKKCTYKYVQSDRGKNKSYNTYFIQEALTEIMCKEWGENDDVIIFLTNKAKKENYYPNNKKKIFYNNGEFKYEHRNGLKHDLETHNYKFNLKPVSIKDGNNMEEIWENFDIIINEIEKGDEIIFDITHAFRYIPILALVVLNYAKSLKNIKIKGIYYGNYEYENSSDNNPHFAKGEKPIMNLIELDEILEWSQAVDSFVKYGNSDHIKQFAETVLDNNKNKNYYKKDEKIIKELVSSLNDFTNTIQTCRGRTVKASDATNSISRAYTQLRDSLDKFTDVKGNNMKPLEHIIGKIEESLELFKPVENRAEIINTGLGIVEWSLDNNLIQQAYTALLETMISYMCILENEDYNDKDKRWKIKKRYDEIFFDNSYLSEYKIQGDIKKEISRTAHELGKIRNDINHYGYYLKSDEKPSTSYEELKDIIENSYYDFKKYIGREESKLIKSYV